MKKKQFPTTHTISTYLSPLPFSLLSLKNSRQHVYVRACNNILKTTTGEITHAIVAFL